MRLKGKIALITAAASGIGRAGAVLFAREGAAVAVADIDRGRIGDTVAEITKAGGRAHGIPCDLTKEADGRRIVRDAIAALGGLDICLGCLFADLARLIPLASLDRRRPAPGSPSSRRARSPRK